MTKDEKIIELARMSQRIAEMSESSGNEVRQAALVLLASLAQQNLKFASSDQ